MAWRAAPIGSRWSCVLAWCVLVKLLSCNLCFLQGRAEVLPVGKEFI